MIAVSSRHPTIPRSCLAPELLLLELRSVLLPKYWPCLTLGRQVAWRKDSLPLLPAQFPGPPQKRPHGRRSHEGSLPIFLPPYSPDLNPIEQLFVNLNQLMRKAERAE